MSTTEEPDETDPDAEPIRRVEKVISAWRWDTWRDAATGIHRSAGWISILLGTAAAALAAAAGFALIPGDGRLSTIVYAPLVGWGFREWTRSRIATHRLKAVLDEMRPEVVPALVDRLDGVRMLRLLTHGGALVPEQSTVIIAERRDAAVALVASEYDMTKFPSFTAGDAGGG